MEKKLPKDFRDFLKLLNVHNVKYLLIGGYAVGYHGYPRATNDIDIWVENSEKNANRTVDAIKEFGFSDPQITPELFRRKKNIIRMGRTPMRIEIILDIDGVEFSKCYKNKMRKRHHTKLIHEGKYIAEVEVELIENEESWSPCISVEDAKKLDDIRDALRRGDIKRASKFARIFSLTPVKN